MDLYDMRTQPTSLTMIYEGTKFCGISKNGGEKILGIRPSDPSKICTITRFFSEGEIINSLHVVTAASNTHGTPTVDILVYFFPVSLTSSPLWFFGRLLIILLDDYF